MYVSWTSRSGPLPPPADIHPAWCSCETCTGQLSPRQVRADVRALLIGASLAAAVVMLKLLGAF